MPQHTYCRICDTRLGEPFLDLGAMPLANAFLRSSADCATEAVYPLAVAVCSSCGLLQLTFTVPAEQLYRDYIYVSSTSEAVRAHAEALARSLAERYRWDRSALVVEIASNDGTVLKAIAQRGVRVLGVEPATNIARIAEADGIPTVNEFFSERLGRTLARQQGPVSAILGRHVFAHIDDLHDCLKGVSALLAEDGVLILEVPYLGDLLDKLEFDTVYHEHLSYFSLGPVQTLCKRHGLRLVDVERIGLHGGSIILHIVRAGSRTAAGPRLEAMLREEQAKGLYEPATMVQFAKRASIWKGQCEELVAGLVRSGARLVGYGAAAKANTLLNYCPEVARTLSAILDRSPHKHGRLTPGTHIVVKPVDSWKDERPTHMVVLAWNFQDEIIRQMRPFQEAGGRFVQVLPDPKVL